MGRYPVEIIVFPHKKVIVEEGITSIENYAFRDCSDLEEISLPKNLTFIGKAIF